MRATTADIAYLNQQYCNRYPFHGELHDHASTGGTSDGACDLKQWRADMDMLGLDFATILDHKQVRHMYLPEWEDGFFLGGTEPATRILDSKAEDIRIHYNMIFANPKQLEALLEVFEEFEFTGGSEGHFIYPRFQTSRFNELIDTVKRYGGFFVHPHPKQLMVSENPEDYLFQEETGIEVFYESMESQYTNENYKLWTDLLGLGKRVWACAGCDLHDRASVTALTTIYAEKHSSEAYVKHLRKGDFVCGPVGIRMCIGDTLMGGQCDFAGEKLICSIGDFHKSVANNDHTYCVKLISDAGVLFSENIDCSTTTYLAFETGNAKYYRLEVFDTTRDFRIAIGNPIWNQ